MAQLDGIRGGLVILVVLVHLEFIPWMAGASRVSSFFVLSGFLISGLLLGQREARDSGRKSIRAIVGRFYLRRALRILPLAYVCMLGMGMVFPDIRREWAWHLTYLTNYFLVFKTPQDLNWLLGHFWSLAVEEQFYFLWPSVILLVPRRALGGTLLAMLVISPFARAVGFESFGDSAYYLMPCNLDAFALGGLLALSRFEPRSVPWVEPLARLGFWVGVPAFTFLCWGREQFNDVLPLFRYALDPMMFSWITLWLVSRASHDAGGGFRLILGNRVFHWIGVRSYSIYVWHPFVIWGISRWVESENLPGHYKAPLAIAAMALVAAVSHALLERPFERLRGVFEKRRIEGEAIDLRAPSGGA